jgi:pyruvate/2-oxoglutarate dehydrogenase complex dihydrolipoamide dehydrogenase (E3) component
VLLNELGQVYLRLGAKVSVVEYMDRIIPGMDASLSKELTKVFKKQGMKFYVLIKCSPWKETVMPCSGRKCQRRNDYTRR